MPSASQRIWMAGASTPEQVEMNAKAVTCNLTAEEVAQIDRIFADA